MENTIIKNPTITEKEYRANLDRFGQILSSVRRSSCDICSVVETIRRSGAFQYDGYGITEFNKYGKEVLGYAKGTLSQMKSVMDLFGSPNASGEYVIDSRVSDYGVEKLYRISRHHALQELGEGADPVAVFQTICDTLELNSAMRKDDIKDIIDTANGKTKPAVEDKSTQTSETAETTDGSASQTEKTETTETSPELKEELEAVTAQAQNAAEFIKQWLHYAEDKKMKDREFRENFIKEAKKILGQE